MPSFINCVILLLSATSICDGFSSSPIVLGKVSSARRSSHIEQQIINYQSSSSSSSSSSCHRRRCRKFGNDAFHSSSLTAAQLSQDVDTDVIIAENSVVEVITSDSNSDDNKSEKKEKTMSTGEAVLALAIPALAAEIIDPLMTAIDTAFVGRFSDSIDALAGMGSASTLLSSSFFVFGFFATATTPLVATQRGAGNDKEAIAISGQALSFALGLGAIMCGLLLSFEQPLLQIMGAADIGQDANGYAKAFLSVRALAAPAVFCIYASTGILRGFLDTKTSVAILVGANAMNFILDVVLVVFAHMGSFGAAIATTTAEWTSALLFLGVLSGKLPSWDGELGNKDNSAAKINDSADTQVNKDGSVSIVPTLSVPTWTDIEPLVCASASVFFRSLVLQLALTSAAAMATRSEGGAASIGAHQIGIQLWVLCSFICDSLAAASQGLIADAIGRKDRQAVKDVSKTVFGYGSILGVFLMSVLYLGYSSDVLIQLFTSDPVAQAQLSQILPLIIIAQPLNSFVFVLDGIMSGASQFEYVAKSMFASVATAVATFLILQYAGENNADTLVHVWSSLLVLQLMRGVTNFYRVVEKDGPIDLLSKEVEPSS